MSSLDPNALDRYITGGRFRSETLVVACPDCEQTTVVTAETEYGMTEWLPAECGSCGRSFDGSEHYEDDEPPEPDHHDDGPSDAFDPRIDYPERYSDGPY